MDPYQRSIYSSTRRRRKAAARRRIVFAVAALAVIALVVVAVVFLYGGDSPSSTTSGSNTSSLRVSQTTGSSGSGSTSGSTGEYGRHDSYHRRAIAMTVAPVDGTKPSDFDMTTHLYDGATRVTTYDRPDPIDFGPGKDYTGSRGHHHLPRQQLPRRRQLRHRRREDGQAAGPVERAHRRPSPRPGGTGSGRAAAGPASRSSSSGRTIIKQIMNIKDAKKAEPGSHRGHLSLPGRQDLLPRPQGRHLHPVAHRVGRRPLQGHGQHLPRRHPHAVRGPRRQLRRASSRPGPGSTASSTRSSSTRSAPSPIPASYRKLVRLRLERAVRRRSPTPSSSRARTASSTPSS